MNSYINPPVIQAFNGNIPHPSPETLFNQRDFKSNVALPAPICYAARSPMDSCLMPVYSLEAEPLQEYPIITAPGVIAQSGTLTVQASLPDQARNMGKILVTQFE